MLQNPHRQHGGLRRNQRAWLWHPWVPRTGRKMCQRAERTSQRGRSKWAAPTSPPAKSRT